VHDALLTAAWAGAGGAIIAVAFVVLFILAMLLEGLFSARDERARANTIAAYELRKKRAQDEAAARRPA